MKTTRKRIATFLLLLVMGVNVIGITAFAGDIQPRMDYCYVNTPEGGNLNGRSGPGTEYPVICQFANGTSLGWGVFDGSAVDSQGNEWTEVSGRDIYGNDVECCWVRDDYLRYERDWRSINGRQQKVYSNPELQPVG